MVDEIDEVLAPTQCLKQVGWNKVIAQEATLQDVFLAYLKLYFLREQRVESLVFPCLSQVMITVCACIDD